MPQPKGNPRIIGFEITSQCNLTCPHCFSAAGKRAYNDMTTADCKLVIDTMARIGVETIGWTGGEPLLRQDLEELIAYAKDKRIKSTVTTNAVLLDEKRAQSLKDSGIRALQISLDGSTPERNWNMRRTTDEEFYKIIEAIRISRRMGFKLILATMLGFENLDDAPAMIALARREGFEAIRFCGYTPIGRGKHRNIRERLDFAQGLERLFAFIQESQADESITAVFDPGFGPVPPGYSFHECMAGLETFYLKGNGNVYPCTNLLNDKFCVGNIREKSLEDIWNSPEMSAMAALPRDQIDGPCTSCDNFYNCHGACRGAAFAHTGNLNAFFPVCLYHFARQSALRR